MKVKLKDGVARPWFVRGVVLVPGADYIEMDDDAYADVKDNKEIEVQKDEPKRGRPAASKAVQSDDNDE